MLFPAQPPSDRGQTTWSSDRAVLLQENAPQQAQLWRALFTLAVGVLLTAAIAALYTSGLVRLVGVETPWWQTPAIIPHFGLVSATLTFTFVWMAISNRGRCGRFLCYLVSGIAPGFTVGLGFRMLSHYRSARKLHQHSAAWAPAH